MSSLGFGRQNWCLCIKSNASTSFSSIITLKASFTMIWKTHIPGLWQMKSTYLIQIIWLFSKSFLNICLLKLCHDNFRLLLFLCIDIFSHILWHLIHLPWIVISLALAIFMMPHAFDTIKTKPTYNSLCCGYMVSVKEKCRKRICRTPG